MIEWVFLLLPVAAASGWFAARRSATRAAAAGKAPDPAYFRGLNYLLNEQPDKAIDVFIKLAEVDSETVETHLALGSLFRRRGEADRAIRIHQNLVARPDLDKEQRAHALYELGRDYMRAGLFDRAESLFRELVEMQLRRVQALEGLRDIYQQEKDWRRCLEVAQEVQALSGTRMQTEIAQYHCELAEEAMRAGDSEAADRHLRDAQAADQRCVRAIMLQARIAMDKGRAEEAAVLHRSVATRSPRFIPEILPALLESHRGSDRRRLLEELKQLNDASPSSPLMLTLAEVTAEVQGVETAMDLLVSYLASYADLAALERLLELRKRGNEPGDAGGKAIHEAVLGVVRELRGRQPDYSCGHCGFAARHLHWQCPSCKHWGSIEPAHPLPIGGRTRASPERRIA